MKYLSNTDKLDQYNFHNYYGHQMNSNNNTRITCMHYLSLD